MDGATQQPPLPPPLAPYGKHEPASSAAAAAPLAQRRGGEDLPPLAHLDTTVQQQQQHHDHHRRRSSGETYGARADAPTQRGSMSSLTSPSTTMYPGPPPPYSYHPTHGTTAPAPARNGYISPPDSRDPPGPGSGGSGSGEEKDAGRRSLPSIHEALAKDHAPLYPPPIQTTALPPPPPGAHAHASAPSSYHASSVVASPTQHSQHSHESHSAGPHSYHPSLPPYSHDSAAEAKHHHPSAGASYPPASVNGAPAGPPRLSPRLAHAGHVASPTHAPNHHAHSQNHLPPAHPPSHAHPPPPPSSQSHTLAPIPAPAYRNYPPAPAYSYPPPPVNTFAAVNVYPPQSQWRPETDGSVDEARKAAAHKHSPGTQHYGEAVKRHLDIFDLETSLNEMAEGCGRGLDFARHFGSRAHQTHRSGPTLASLPSLAECDDMLKRHDRVLAALARVRDFVVAQQHAEQQQQQAQQAQQAQQQQQQQQQQQERARDDPPAAAPHIKHGADYDGGAETPAEKAERERAAAAGGGGFAGGDAKKRRGRNAPPGRCHSCNRAETPEWRRGPDGARTLCNACGLHYAKLTRKHGAKAGLGSSNLRPKENGDA